MGLPPAADEFDKLGVEEYYECTPYYSLSVALKEEQKRLEKKAEELNRSIAEQERKHKSETQQTKKCVPPPPCVLPRRCSCCGWGCCVLARAPKRVGCKPRRLTETNTNATTTRRRVVRRKMGMLSMWKGAAKDTRAQRKVQGLQKEIKKAGDTVAHLAQRNLALEVAHDNTVETIRKCVPPARSVSRCWGGTARRCTGVVRTAGVRPSHPACHLFRLDVRSLVRARALALALALCLVPVTVTVTVPWWWRWWWVWRHAGSSRSWTAT